MTTEDAGRALHAELLRLGWTDTTPDSCSRCRFPTQPLLARLERGDTMSLTMEVWSTGLVDLIGGVIDGETALELARLLHARETRTPCPRCRP